MAGNDYPRAASTARSRAGLLTLMGAGAVTATGAGMSYVAVPWFVLQTTGSVARTGAVLAVAAVGGAATGFLAGPVVDRVGFKRASVGAYVLSGAAMSTVVVLFVTDRLTFAALVALVLLTAAFDEPRGVAISGLVPGLARDAGMSLERANATLRAISSTSLLLGPALGGLAAALIGAHLVLLFDAVAALAAAALVGLFVMDRAGHTSQGRRLPEPLAARRPGYLADLREGVRTVREVRLLRSLVVTGAVRSALHGGVNGIVLVAIADRWWGSAASLGAMVTCGALGVLVGTLLYAAVGHRVGRRPVYLGASLALGLPLAVLGFAPPLAVALVAVGLFAMVFAPLQPLVVSALQETVPRRVFGRVGTTITVFTASAVPAGIAATATAVAVFGLRPAILGLAVGYLLLGAACWRVAAFHDLNPPGSRAGVLGRPALVGRGTE